jgi:hypothetical protein
MKEEPKRHEEIVWPTLNDFKNALKLKYGSEWEKYYLIWKSQARYVE